MCIEYASPLKITLVNKWYYDKNEKYEDYDCDESYYQIFHLNLVALIIEQMRFWTVPYVVIALNTL